MERLSLRGRRKREVERLLRAQYASERQKMQSEAKRARSIEGCARAIESDRSRSASGPIGAWHSELSFASFLAIQTRIIPARIWMAQAAVIAFALWVCAMVPVEGFANCAATALGSVVAGAGVPLAAASRTYGMAELECACRFNCRSVVAARMAVIGAVDALMLGVSACVAPVLTESHALSFAVYACVPYFAVCAGSFAVSRRMRNVSAPAASAACVLVAIGACVLMQRFVPWTYSSAAIGVWAVAAAAAGVWLAREAHAFLRDASEGIDVLGCLGRSAYNEKRCDISWS